MNIRYRPFNASDSEEVALFIQDLYREDPGNRPVSPQKIQKTFDSLTEHPDRGSIVVIERGGERAGYAILVNFWSNEFGGNIVDIDELYVKKEFRSQGIATGFIRYLAENRPGDSVALRLEVTPANNRARQLYEKLGFKRIRNDTLHMELPQG